jgi:hypothetical protein
VPDAHTTHNNLPKAAKPDANDINGDVLDPMIATNLSAQGGKNKNYCASLPRRVVSYGFGLDASDFRRVEGA